MPVLILTNDQSREVRVSGTVVQHIYAIVSISRHSMSANGVCYAKTELY